MSFFSKIRDAILGPIELDKNHAPKPAPAPATKPAAPAPQAGTHPPVQPAPQPTSVVDVEHSLDSRPGADNLNWRSSIVDLLKLIGVDSDFASRKELAEEMGKTDYKGDADDNLWLHKRVMQELAKNGGKVPESLR